MASKLTLEQKNKLIYLLQRDRINNYQDLEYYLRRITTGHPVEFVISDTESIQISAREAWELIAEWGGGEEGNLPVGDSGSINFRATRLLAYIRNNLIGQTSEAAGSYQSILEQAQHPTLPTNKYLADQKSVSLQKALDQRRRFIETYEAKLLGKLKTAYQQSEWLKKFNKEDQAILASLFAADSANLRAYSDRAPDHLRELMLHQAGAGNINNAMRMVYSEEAEREIPELIEINNRIIKEVYGNDEKQFQKDAADFRAVSRLSPTLSDIDTIVNLIATDASAQEKAKLSQSLRSAVIMAAHSGEKHTSGQEITAIALREAGLSPQSASALSALAPILEEVEIKQRHQLLVPGYKQNDARELSTASIAAALGVDLSIPWLREKDITAATKTILTGYDTDNPYVAFEVESNKTNPNLEKLAELKNIINLREQRTLFEKRMNDNPWLRTQLGISKRMGNLRSLGESYEEFSSKLWAPVIKVDEFIHEPFRKTAEWWDGIKEKATTNIKLKNGRVVSITWLDPAGFVYNQWTALQKRVALGIFKWSSDITRRAATNGRWYAGIFRQVSDFSRSFYKSDANWNLASFNFLSRKWGNALDWSTQRLFNKSWGQAKIAIAETLWSGFTKIAPGLAAKMSKGALGKLAATFLAGELTAGTSLLIQAGLMAVGAVFKGIVRFFKDAKFRNDFINRIPLMVGAAVSGLIAIPAIALTFITGAIPALIAAFGTLFTGLVALFSQAFLWVGVVVMSIFLLLQMAKVTSHIDSGVALFNAVFCNQEGSATNGAQAGGQTGGAESAKGSSIASCATCLVEYLQACYGADQVSGSEIQTSGVGCLIAKAVAPDVAEAIASSATQYNWLQCVGFARAAVRCAGGDLGTDNGGRAAGYINNAPPGFRYVSGAQYCRTGDLGLVDGAIGHIFVVDNVAGPVTYGIDANYVCDGCVSAKSPIPTVSVAGCLKKI